MTNRTKFLIGGVVVGLILLLFNFWVGIVVIGAAIAIPGIAWAMLDPSQRRRVRNLNRRGIGR